MTERLLKAIAGIIDSDSIIKDKPSQLSPLLRLSVALLAIVLCACSKNAIFVISILSIELIRLDFLRPERIIHVLKRLVLPVIFTLFIMLPAVFLGHESTMLTVTMKVAESVLILLLMNENLSWKEITGTFTELHIPSVFTMTLDTTVHFLVVLGRLAEKIHEAYSLRSFGYASDKHRISAAGGILGTVFLKASHISQESYEAMLCRGYNGTYRRFSMHKFSIHDVLYLIVVPAMIFFLFLLKKQYNFFMNTIELKNISFQYSDGTIGLENIDLSLSCGKCYVIKGPNGCGKSTLFRILNGLSFPTKGEYFFEGTAVTQSYLHDKKNAAAFHSKIGFLFQNTEVMLFTGSVEDEIAFGLYQMGLSDEEVKKRTEHYISALSLEYLRKRAPFNISVGEKKRVALASILSMEPDVLMMDEPLSGLDEDGQYWITETLQSLKSQDRLLIIATHNDNLVHKISDETICLDKHHHIVK